MLYSEIMSRSYDICKQAGLPSPRYIRVDNFLEYSGLVLDIVKDWSKGQIEKNEPWAKDWLRGFLTLRDDFELEVSRDPMILYKPKHDVALAFHSSPARIRYFRAGNRTSKTQSGYSEHYFVTTGHSPYRDFGDISGPQMTFILSGLPFTVYEGDVFEKKFISGEPNNFLSPMFPEGGKWLNKYDRKSHSITIACPECAQKNQAGSCKHINRSKITLLSAELGTGVVEAFKAKLGHIDEYVPKEFFPAIQMRLQDTPDSAIVITSTPKQGPYGWEQIQLVPVAEGPREKNLSDPDDPNSPPYVEMFEIDQFAAGIAPHKNIRASMQTMTEFEIAAAIMGKPVALAKNPVFDRQKLQTLNGKCVTPDYYDMFLDEDVKLDEVVSHENNWENCQIKLFQAEPDCSPRKWTGVRVWELPQKNANYIASIDTAEGLTSNDASCCSILKLYKDPRTMTLRLKLCAQWWGWKTTLKYAEECFKLSVLYNDALAVVETTGGFGDAVVQVLRDNLTYWNMFRDKSDKKQAEMSLGGRFGVDTNRATKPYFIGCLQDFIKEERIDIYDVETITELVAYEQENVGVGGAKLLTPRFGGAQGHKDDRVMSIALGCGVALSHIHMFEFEEELVTDQIQSAGGADAA